jgi:phage major head subunit gpT-like protein
VSFFADNHVSGDSGAQDNKLTASATDPDSPTVDEFKEALKTAIGTMLAFKDDQGDPMALSANGMVAVVPTTMLFTALEAINSTVASNTRNALESAARIIAFPWLTDASKWYLLKTDGVVRPFIFQDREPIEFSALTEDSDEGFRREKFLYGVRARYRLTYGYWQFGVRTDFV